MSGPNINLKTLEYDSIKNELIDFLKSKEEFSDYNFEGSALSTIIDLLTFNTFYQIFFQNILVNEMFIDTAQKLESIISHAKIQGYLVPGKISSFATLKITTANENEYLPPYQKIIGSKVNGDIKLFYNLNGATTSIPEGGSSPEILIDIYEAKRFVNGSVFALNEEKQSVFIPDIDMDYRTLKVEVSETGNENDFQEYRVGNNVEPNLNIDSKVCFLERTLNGYEVFFAGKYNESTGIYIENALPSNAIIKLTYLVSSGSSGNGSSSFSFVSTPTTLTNPTIVSTTGASYRGKNEPSIEELKFNIPRQFSAQNRVVTKEDVKSFLIKNGFSDNYYDILVEGGEERDPDLFLGKVFFNIIGITTQQAQTAEKLLNDYSIAGILYEYDPDLTDV